MEIKTRKVILFIAMSLDGYIAKNNGDISFLSLVDVPDEDYGYKKFYDTVDTVILGRKTYDKILTFGIEFPHRFKKCYVVSRTLSGNEGLLEFYDGDLTELINNLRCSEGKDIFIDGGAELVNELMKRNLIDKYIISIIPVFLGEGIRLFNHGYTERKLTLKRSAMFKSGLAQLEYEKNEE